MSLLLFAATAGAVALALGLRRSARTAAKHGIDRRLLGPGWHNATIEGSSLLQRDPSGLITRANIRGCWWPPESDAAVKRIIEQGPVLLLCGNDAQLVDGRRLSQVIVSEGLGFANDEQLLALEQQAKASLRGLWFDDPAAKYTYAARRCGARPLPPI